METFMKFFFYCVLRIITSYQLRVTFSDTFDNLYKLEEYMPSILYKL